MKLSEKLKYLQDNHFGDWLKMRKEVEAEFSEKQSMFCICGKLATGLHESYCRKFSDSVTKETVKRLERLIVKTKICE